MHVKSPLLAVSGGLDSMVMLHQMVSKYGNANIHVAHVNFQLRGTASDEDEEYVKEVCSELEVPCFTIRFDTLTYAAEHGIGIQEAARELRYDWFFQVMEETGCDALATAHHQDDSTETFFINLLRGSGPKGLSGIQEDHERRIIRPLLHIDRKAILEYAKEHDIKWREDSSNQKGYYLRNRIRKELIPLLGELRTGFQKAMIRNMDIQASMDAFLEDAAMIYAKTHIEDEGNSIRIQPDGMAHEELMLNTLLRPFGFSEDQISSILETEASGKQVISSSHVMTSHRGGILLDELKVFPQGPWEIRADLKHEIPFTISIEILDKQPDSWDESKQVAYLDMEDLIFPLELRVWQEGDRFRPLGMTGSKLVSDFLIDEKVPLEEKKRVLVILNKGEIIWLVGHRISENLKVSVGTKKILRVSLED